MRISTPVTTNSAVTPGNSLLQRAIQVDLIFILLTSLLFIIFSVQLAVLSGMSSTLLLVLGFACLAYAGFLWWAQNRLPLRTLGWANVSIGYLWVAASILLLASGWIALTSFGFWLVVALAVAVDLIASVQAYALIKRR